MSYLVLARKYRPQSFEDLVGQEHVARTLANAISQGRVAHAFLFTGVRGVGKTTSARLLAKCLNCMGPPGPDGKGTTVGPTATPCQVCAPCIEIAAGNDIDVQEIDGASYNGVDEVRRLQEGLAFRPARDRFKIYIVDEVHMLSTQAWNAFLKTLEEPPPHVKFIFATTEVHKVPVTILSRCQRYDFKLIGARVIAKRLEEVLAKESIDADAESVAVLAREAAGSMRDAMSLLDQVIAYSGTKLSGDDVTRVLGVANRKVLHELASALVTGNAAAALGIIDALAQQGFDLPHVARDILRLLRDIVVAKVCGESGRSLLDLADEEVRDVFELAARAEPDDLLRLHSGFSKGFDEIVRSGQPRAALEMTLVRLARRPALLPLDELLSRLGDLEKRLGGAPPPAPRGGGGGGPRPLKGATSSGFERAEVQSAPMARSEPPGAPRLRSIGALALAPEENPTPTPAPVSATNPVEPVPVASEPVAQPLEHSESLDPWRTIVDAIRAQNARVASVLEHAVLLEFTAERVRLGYDASQTFLSDQMTEPEALDLVTRSIRHHFGAPTELALDLSEVGAARGPSVFAVDAEKRKTRLAEARKAVENHPIVKETIRLFGAELRDVKLPKSVD